jgi:hypothetical protein
MVASVRFLIVLTSSRVWPALLFAILCQTIAGCSSITVRRSTPSDLIDAWRASLAEADDLSPRTLQTLRRWDLERLYHRSPIEAYASLQTLALRDPQPDQLFALAEMSYFFGRQAEKHEKPDAIRFYYLCAGYAYHYLFDGEAAKEPTQRTNKEEWDNTQPPAPFPGLRLLDGSPSCFDPRFRLACDLYNAGLAKCIRAAQRVGRLDPCRQLHCPTPDGRGFLLSVVHEGFIWKPEEFGPLLFCDDFQVEGLANQYHGYGLGVPLIGTRLKSAPAPPHAFYPREVSFPVTAFFRFDGRLADLGAHCAGRLVPI